MQGQFGFDQKQRGISVQEASAVGDHLILLLNGILETNPRKQKKTRTQARSPLKHCTKVSEA